MYTRDDMHAFPILERTRVLGHDVLRHGEKEYRRTTHDNTNMAPLLDEARREDALVVKIVAWMKSFWCAHLFLANTVERTKGQRFVTPQ